MRIARPLLTLILASSPSRSSRPGEVRAQGTYCCVVPDNAAAPPTTRELLGRVLGYMEIIDGCRRAPRSRPRRSSADWAASRASCRSRADPSAG